MSNELNRVTKKLFGNEQVNLESQVIELGTLDEIEAAIKVAVDEYGKIDSYKSQLYEVASTARNKLTAKVEKIDKLIALFEQQAKDLGLKGKIPAAENAKKLIGGDKERLKKVQSFLNNLSKAQI